MRRPQVINNNNNNNNKRHQHSLHREETAALERDCGRLPLTLTPALGTRRRDPAGSVDEKTGSRSREAPARIASSGEPVGPRQSGTQPRAPGRCLPLWLLSL